VKDLEEKVRILTSDSKADDRISELLEEQMRLKELCSSLSAKLDRIRNITCEDRKATQKESPSKDSNQPSPGKDKVQAVAAGPAPETSVGPGEFSDVSIDKIFRTSVECCAEAPPIGEDVFEQQTNVCCA
jgi:hypothetical protein